MFRGIDNDEAVFLEFASKQQAEIDGRRFAVTPEVKEFRVSFPDDQTKLHFYVKYVKYVIMLFVNCSGL